MITFAPNLIGDFSKNPDIILNIQPRWCDGNVLDCDFSSPQSSEDYEIISHNLWTSTRVYISKKYAQKIDGGFISYAKNRYIFSHKEAILSRCGCGKSFSFKSGNEAKDKIFLFKKKLRQAKKSSACE